ncbi:type II secretion system protein [Chitinibacter tainanensis]|uniref:type II secretion system protein n=1 Tax=Chitinibacter tainanensis TaxID=230667 RepID=UPI00235560FA|nr:prepilin-type N-terminal cleavage/methylation domain-containing protein [Chitinibacter tainanensis]
MADRHQRGFSLVEMAMVLVILGLMIGGFLGPLTETMEAQRIRQAKREMAEAKEAILGFMIKNQRFPCPADPTVAESDATSGTEKTPSATGCARTEGALPWKDLGLKQLDPWGRRYSYAVAPRLAATSFSSTGSVCAAPVPSSGASFNWCSPTTIQIKTSSSTADVAPNVAAVVISHGKNGLGGYDQGGTQISGATNDELENADNDTVFIQTQFDPNRPYDDLVEWISPAVTFNRMVQAQLLP